MKKTFLISLTLLLSCLLMADGVQPEGSGSEADPYQVANLHNLLWVSTTPSSWDANFIQTAHINALPTIEWNETKGLASIGSGPQAPFTGSYDGQYYVIIGLHSLDEDNSYQGMFGATSGALLHNIRLKYVNISGRSYVGGLVGSLENESMVSNCSVKGKINGHISGLTIVGGFVGNCENSIIQNSSADVGVNGTEFVGGFVGKNNSEINNCYSLGNLTAESSAGGFAGSNLNTDLHNCYSTGLVDAISNYGGLIGQSDSTNLNSFWNIETSQQNSSAGGIGKTTAEMNNVFTYTDTITTGLSTPWDFVNDPGNDEGQDDIWDINSIDNSGYPHHSWESFNDTLYSGTSLTPILISYVGTSLEFLHHPGDGNAISWEWDFDFDGITDSYEEVPEWSYSEPGSYTISLMISDGNNVIAEVPFNCLEIYEQEGIEPTGSGTVMAPYEIANLENLRWLSTTPDAWGYYYIQTADIDATDTVNWNNGMGFRPIGFDYLKCFQGTYDGQNFSIDGLFIDRSTTSSFILNRYTGLFGIVQFSTLQNINLTNVTILGENFTGGIAGNLEQSRNLANCHVTGNITGNGYTGGLIGIMNLNHISNCSFSGNITGHVAVGGLIGFYTDNIEIDNFGEIVSLQNCSTDGEIFATARVGGIIGYFDDGLIENCVSNISVTTVGGNTGGFIGTGSYGVINNSYSQGQVSGINYVGGFSGASSKMYYRNCFSNSDASAGWAVGGFIGNSFVDTLAYCYSSGSVAGDSDIGGLVGLNPYNLSINNNSFWDIESSGYDYSSLGTGLTTTEMTNEQTFLEAGWDFVGETTNGIEDIWAMDSTINDGYPYLFGMEPVVSSQDDEVPQLTTLNLKNYPNPFNPETSISFNTTEFENIKSAEVEIFNIKGQKVNSLSVDLASDKNSVKTVKWQGIDRGGNPVSSGVYFYKLVVNGKDEAVKKCLLLK